MSINPTLNSAPKTPEAPQEVVDNLPKKDKNPIGESPNSNQSNHEDRNLLYLEFVNVVIYLANRN